MRRFAFVILLTTIAACAPKTIPPPAISSTSPPKYPDFVAPAVPASLAAAPSAAGQARGWLLLQAGDLKSAEREFSSALKLTAGFYPAEAGLGYVELARDDAKAALPHFDRALEQDPKHLSSLLGRGRSLLALNREADALPAFEAALAIDPSLAEVARRVEVMQFRRQQNDLNQARTAALAGRQEEAIGLYNRAIQASPDSAFLYRELAGVERQGGLTDRALEHFAKAVALEPGDAASRVQIGEMLEARDDFAGAAEAFAAALAIEPDSRLESKLQIVRARAEVARLPAEYRDIDSAAQITRGDLAALIGVRLAGLLRTTRTRDAVLITDIRTHWAASWIVTVTRAGVMEAFANHAFQPQTVVRRVDLAQVVNRLLVKVAEATPGKPHPWTTARLKFSDLAPGHLAYPAASAAVAAGAMTTGANDSFQPSTPVSGKEAGAAIERVASLVPAATVRGNSPR
jgi:tetratricopeptide (TPR) repeat protein